VVATGLVMNGADGLTLQPSQVIPIVANFLTRIGRLRGLSAVLQLRRPYPSR